MHLGAETSARVGRDLARLVDAHPGHEIILAGDAFDLSYALRHDAQAALLSSLLERTPELVAALHRHVASGATLTVLPGNHDAALGDEDVAGLLRERLDVASDAPVSVSPWFVRRGDLHIEHGHVYDPDNAPVHPLAEWNEKSEPLGIALTRRFVAATGASDFSHAQDATPVRALSRAFRLYGLRAPGMIASYFKTAIELCLEAGPSLSSRASEELSIGSARLQDFADRSGVPGVTLSTLLAGAPRPTHLSRRDTFLRLYFDRVFASLVLAGSLTAIPRRPAASSIMALASFAYLAGSVLRSHDRYGDLPNERLRLGASRVRAATGARVVVFGHTHHVMVDDGYFNTGSFAFPRDLGRPYVHVDEHGAPELRRIPAG
jgi:UDP-2,3-diacylglucosamine pyrophosphatase LpxH